MTNDNLEQNEQQLRLATARLLPAGTTLDGETTALRDDFLALGGALDAAAGPLDESALIARLQQSRRAEQAPAALTSGRSQSTWQAVFSLALALAALVAIVRIVAPPTVATPAGKSVAAKPAAPGPSAVADAPRIPAPATPSRGAWFDPLDEEIALAQVEFQRISKDDRGVDGSLSRMTERLEALSQELFQGSL